MSGEAGGGHYYPDSEDETPADPVTAALEEIRERYEYLGPLYKNTAFMLDAVVQDVPRLLAAIEAVLELTGSADPILSGFSDMTVIGFRLDPKAVRAAITRELTGTQLSEDENHG